VLPLLPNQLFVSLSKDHIAMIYRGGFAKRLISEIAVSWTSDKFDWKGLIYRLERELDKLNLPSRTELSVTLSSEMVRYLTLPGNDFKMNESEKSAYANAAYLEIYGFVTDDWRIKCHDAPPNQPMLTSAIDLALIESIEKLAAKYQFNLKSVQPYLMTAFNALHHKLKNATALFAVVEPNRILFVNLQKGYCSQVRTYHRTTNWQEIVTQFLARETLIGDDNIRDILVYAPSQAQTALPFANDWMLKVLSVKQTKLSTIDQTPYAMLEALI
jgi:hypothetical protein